MQGQIKQALSMGHWSFLNFWHQILQSRQKKRPGCSRQCLAFRQECDGNPVQAPGREYPIVKMAAKGGSQG